MQIGRVVSVNASGRTANAKVYGPDGDYILRNVHISEPFSFVRTLPRSGQLVSLDSVGSDWFITGYLYQEGPNTSADNEDYELAAGDLFFGDKDSQHMGLLRGGMMVFMANPVTGVMAIDQNKALNLLAHNFYFDNSVYHKEVRTEGTSAKTWVTMAGLGGLKKIEQSADLESGEVEYETQGLSKVSLKINNNIIDVTGADIEFQMKTTTGQVKLTIDGTTGNIDLETGGITKIQSQKVGINSDCIDPLDGVVTGHTQCPYTLGGHIDCSRVVYVGKS